MWTFPTSINTGYPWIVFGKNPNLKWMMTGASPILRETPILGFYDVKCSRSRGYKIIRETPIVCNWRFWSGKKAKRFASMYRVASGDVVLGCLSTFVQSGSARSAILKLPNLKHIFQGLVNVHFWWFNIGDDNSPFSSVMGTIRT